MRMDKQKVLAAVKKALRALVLAAALVFFLGAFWLIVLFFGAFGAFPLYVTRVIPVLGVATTAAAVLAASGYLPPRALRWLGRGTLAVCGLCLLFVAHGAYDEYLVPTLDDRTLMLEEYTPFREGTKAASLDRPASLQMEAAAAERLRLDGATALYPVYAAFVQAVYPEETYLLTERDRRVACAGTVRAYRRLVNGDADVIFAAEPSQAQRAYAAFKGMELHMTPIGREAFVFFVHRWNPVDSLTLEQLRGIYSGEITSWRQAGGLFGRIRAFQRTEDSGSQSALLRLMGNTPLREPEKREVIGGMGEIIREVASYRNYLGAIGFSFRFYASEMAANRQIKLLALEGVAPTKESIRDGSYPIASSFYAVTASPIGEPAPEETDGDLAAFLAWIRSPEGQELVEKTGYVGLGQEELR